MNDNSATLKDLLTRAVGKAKEKAAINKDIRDLTAKINAIRDNDAAQIVAEKFGIKPGVYVRNGSRVLRIDEIVTDRLSEHSVGDVSSMVNARDLVVHRFSAHCTRIHAGTGKPIELRGGRYGNSAEIRYETETIDITDRTVIIPESEIKTKRTKTEKSEAVKALASLSESDLRKLLKQAKKL